MSTKDDLVMPLESAEFIMQSAKHVKISDSNLQILAKKIHAALYDKSCNYFDWKASPLNPKKMNEFAINWIFLVDCLNFSFWSDAELQVNHSNAGSSDAAALAQANVEKYTVIYNNVAYHGYWALCAAINRALDDGYPIVEPHFYAHLNETEFKHIFRSDSKVQIPLANIRLKIMQESGKILIEEFRGSFMNCVKLANGSAKYLLKLIISHFPSFRDEAQFMNRKVTFYKRAQILVADVWGCFEGQGVGYFADIDQITMFADYRVPQVLQYYNVIEYSDELKDFLRSNQLLNSGAIFEVEIRAASIVACHLLSLEIKKLLQEDDNTKPSSANILAKPIVNDILVDFYLWNFRVDNAKEIDKSLPFHKIRCIYY